MDKQQFYPNLNEEQDYPSRDLTERNKNIKF